MRPPCSSTRLLDRARPRPVPSGAAVAGLGLLELLEDALLVPGSIPGPVSVTATSTSPFSCARRLDPAAVG